MIFEDYEPCYVISVAAKMVGIHAQTLRYYEKEGLIEPSRSQGRVRFYSRRDIDRLRQIRTLVNDLGVNLAGADIIIRLNERIAEMEKQIHDMDLEIKRLREAGL
jgi:MerR family transcriptional regulator/heat shock protein HspR